MEIKIEGGKVFEKICQGLEEVSKNIINDDQLNKIIDQLESAEQLIAQNEQLKEIADEYNQSYDDLGIVNSQIDLIQELKAIRYKRLEAFK